MGSRYVFMSAAIASGALFTLIGMPAGWLIGALIFGVIYRFTIDHIDEMPDSLFRSAIACIGACIGMMMQPSLFMTLLTYMVPLIVTLALTVAAALLFGKLLHYWTGLDPLTATFCCIPGGASEAIALSKDYGADERIVAAFHSARIVLFVFSIPLIAGLSVQPELGKTAAYEQAHHESFIHSFVTEHLQFEWIALGSVALVGTAAMLINARFKVPAGPFLYAMVLAFILNQTVIGLEQPPAIVISVGQAVLGGIIGLKFEKEALEKLKKISVVGIMMLLSLLASSFAVTGIFYLWTDLGYITSLLSLVPAGAGEMASTAYVLDLDASIVASLHIIRLGVVFAMMPILAHYLAKKYGNNDHKRGVHPSS